MSSDHLALFAREFRANPTATAGKRKAVWTNALYGLKCTDYSTSPCPVGLLSRMLLASSRWNCYTSSLTWKLWVTPCNHSLFRLVQSGHGTNGNEPGLLPTVSAYDAQQRHNRKDTGNMENVPTNALLGRTIGKLLPTVDANCGERGGQNPERIDAYRNFTINDAVRATPGQKDGLRLSPAFAEWMMGYPEGWTDIESLG